MGDSSVTAIVTPSHHLIQILRLYFSGLRSKKEASNKQDEDEQQPFMEGIKSSSSWQNRDEGMLVLRSNNSCQRTFGTALTIINIVLLCLTTAFLVLINRSRRISSSSSVNTSPYQKPEFNSALKQLSSYSPIFDALDLGSKTVQFDGRFFNDTSIYRGDPSPEVDKAWQFLDHDIWTVSEDTVRRVHKDPSRAIKVDPKWGMGDDAYIATYDFVHQIHCLNTLRKEIHYGRYWNSTPPSEMHLAHRNHCLHMLLQAIVCHADVDVITYEWVYVDNPETGARSYTPWPDFNSVKKCRDFDTLYPWMEDHVQKQSKALYENIEKPADAPARSIYDT